MSAKTISRCLLRCVQSLHPLLAVATVSVLFASCTRHSAVWPRLLEVEALLETDPHAAGAMIDSIDATPLTGEDAALYAILKTQADYKLYHPLTSDSLPRLATDYYGTPYRKNYHAAMAWYTLGCYYTQQIRDVQAIDAYLNAKDLFPDTLVRYYAYTLQDLGKLYINHHDYVSAEPLLLSLYCHPKVRNDSTLMSDADYLLSLLYLRTERMEQAARYLQRISDNPHSKPSYIRSSLFQLAKIYYTDSLYDNSLDYVNRYVSSSPAESRISAGLMLKGYLFEAFQQYDSAFYYFDQSVRGTDDVSTLVSSYGGLLRLPLSLVADSFSRYTSAYELLLDSLYAQERLDEISKIGFEHELSAYMQASFRHRRMMLLFVTLLLIIGILCVTCYVLRKQKCHALQISSMRKKLSEGFQREAELKAEHEVMMSSLQKKLAEGLQREVDLKVEHEVKVASLRQELADSHQRENDILLQLQERSLQSDSVYERNELKLRGARDSFTSSRWTQLLQDSVTASAEAFMPASDRDALQSYLQTAMSDFVRDLTNSNKDINKEDVLLCCMAILGLSLSQISYCTARSVHSLECRASRLKSKMTPEWYQYVFGAKITRKNTSKKCQSR